MYVWFILSSTFFETRQREEKADRLTVSLLWFIYGPRQANLVLIAYASSEGSGEPAHPCSLARTSATRSYKQWVKRNPTDRKPDPWPFWIAGHAQLKFVMTECSKTQIRLTGLIYKLYELGHVKSNNTTRAYRKHPGASVQFDQSLGWPHEKVMDTWLPVEGQAETDQTPQNVSVLGFSALCICRRFLLHLSLRCDIWLLQFLGIFSATFEPRHDKTNKVTVRPAKVQIGLGVRPVWSESSLSA